MDIYVDGIKLIISFIGMHILSASFEDECRRILSAIFDMAG
jgi:hypothetical protein